MIMIKTTPNRTRGFTLIEVTLVIIVIGILTMGLAPLLLRQFSGGMEERDRIALEDAKTAIINYAITFGGVPNPLTMNASGGIDTATVVLAETTGVGFVGMMRPSGSNIATLANYVVPAFGVNHWGAYGDATTTSFRLDVNDALKSTFTTFLATGTASTTASTGDRVTFCQAVNQVLTDSGYCTPVSTNYRIRTSADCFAGGGAWSTGPSMCQDTSTEHKDTATACGASSPAAFVLISTGADRAPNQENNEALAGIVNNRIYENDRRGIENSHGNYDDQLKSYPLSGFARDCREKMGISQEAMSCAPGQKYVGMITNNYTAAVAYTFNGILPPPLPVSQTVTPGLTVSVNACVNRASTLTVGSGGLVPAASAMDVNNDGRVDVFITGPTTFTAQ